MTYIKIRNKKLITLDRRRIDQSAIELSCAEPRKVNCQNNRGTEH